MKSNKQISDRDWSCLKSSNKKKEMFATWRKSLSKRLQETCLEIPPENCQAASGHLDLVSVVPNLRGEMDVKDAVKLPAHLLRHNATRTTLPIEWMGVSGCLLSLAFLWADILCGNRLQHSSPFGKYTRIITGSICDEGPQSLPNHHRSSPAMDGNFRQLDGVGRQG